MRMNASASGSSTVTPLPCTGALPEEESPGEASFPDKLADEPGSAVTSRARRGMARAGAGHGPEQRFVRQMTQTAVGPSGVLMLSSPTPGTAERHAHGRAARATSKRKVPEEDDSSHMDDLSASNDVVPQAKTPPNNKRVPRIALPRIALPEKLTLPSTRARGRGRGAAGVRGGAVAGCRGRGRGNGKIANNSKAVEVKRKGPPSSGFDYSDEQLRSGSPSPQRRGTRHTLRRIKRKKYTDYIEGKDDSDNEEDDEDQHHDQEVTGNQKNDSKKRRGTRHTLRRIKRKKYTDYIEGKDDSDNEEDDEDQHHDQEVTGNQKNDSKKDEPNEEDKHTVAQMISVRTSKKETSSGQCEDVEEYLVKYKDRSYMHCEWVTQEQLYRDKQITKKLRHLLTKMEQNIELQEDGVLFNPDYLEVDRILTRKSTIDNNKYLVKWCSQAYEDCTWEKSTDVDQAKVEEFNRFHGPFLLRRTPRPPHSAWEKLEAPVYKNGHTLRDYQLEGLNWLLFNWYYRQNCILADEMGLGKTVQSIALLTEMHAVGIHGPFLVIVPLSTIGNWEREFRTWSYMNAVVYYGTVAGINVIQEHELFQRDKKGRVLPKACKFDTLITTYEMVKRHQDELKSFDWRCVVIDEAHVLKNRHCKLLESLSLLNMEHKVLLTGTPLQNCLEELWSLLHFLEPEQFSLESEFREEFGNISTKEEVNKLQVILKPMMLRRLKEDVEKNLIPKQETIIEVELTDMQKNYYRAILERNFNFLRIGVKCTNMPSLMNTMMELRKCCNHPFLISGAEEMMLAELERVLPPEAPDFPLQALVRSSGKLVLLDKLLPRLQAGGHRVLIFSQMVRVLDILEDYLVQKSYLYERIDGGTPRERRQAAIDRFSQPDSVCFVFLLSTRAGGVGINLTAADTCIIYDSDWNPQNDLQAQARCHRIGQTKSVKVYRLVTKNSCEQLMLEKASRKLGLDQAVLQTMSGSQEKRNNGIQQFSKQEVEQLLKRGAYAVMEESDESKRFCEEDIDQILQRRATTITIESEGKSSTFSKASFVASENQTDVVLDDPEFWQKWAKKANIDLESVNENSLVIDMPRVRKKTRHYTAQEEEGETSGLNGQEDEHKRPLRKRGWSRAQPGQISDTDPQKPPETADQQGPLKRPLGPKRPFRCPNNCFSPWVCRLVEKGLLAYGWGRWEKILYLVHKKWDFRAMTQQQVEDVCRAIVAESLTNYTQSGSLKAFLWEIIAPSKEGEAPKTSQTHPGLYAGSARQHTVAPFDLENVQWLKGYNPKNVLEDVYLKSLLKRSYKVLLRVRLLYLLRHDVIGPHAETVMGGVPAKEIPVPVPKLKLPGMVEWWDDEADRSLVIGVYKHGYERYQLMRDDPCLCFLKRVGPSPKTRRRKRKIEENSDSKGQEINDSKGQEISDSKDQENKFSKGQEISALKGQESDSKGQENNDSKGQESNTKPTDCSPDEKDTDSRPEGLATWPEAYAITVRFKKLFREYSRLFWIQRQAKEAKHRFKETQSAKQKWNSFEQRQFCRVMALFGVERLNQGAGAQLEWEGQLDWTRFREKSHLAWKLDGTLSQFFRNVIIQCKRQCRKPLALRELETREGDEEGAAGFLGVSASQALAVVRVLQSVRERVLPSPLLAERLALAWPCPSLPRWWVSPRHDRELLQAAARHGLSSTAFDPIFTDPEFSFGWDHTMYLCDVMKGLDATGGATGVAGPSQPPSEHTTSSRKDVFGANWPRCKVLLKRLEQLCAVVLTGQWPEGDEEERQLETAVRSHFDYIHNADGVVDDSSYMICKTCKSQKRAQGGFISDLVLHLQNYHAPLYAQAIRAHEGKEEPSEEVKKTEEETEKFEEEDADFFKEFEDANSDSMDTSYDDSSIDGDDCILSYDDSDDSAGNTN